jgi:hypothetical protein
VENARSCLTTRESLWGMNMPTGRPFRGSVAVAAGLSRRTLQGPGFRRLFVDVYIDSAVLVTTRTRAEGALLVSPEGTHVSHHTAAHLWGAAVPDSAAVHVSTPGTPSRRSGIIGHRKRAGAEVTERNMLPLSTPREVYREMAQQLSLVDLVVLGDSLVRAGRLTPAELVECARTFTGHGAARARRAAAWVREGVDSPMETRLRMLLVLAGLPEPVVGHRIHDEHGQLRLRLDLCYPSLKLSLEYDGRHHAESEQQWGRDLSRREDLDRRGWRVLVVRARDIYDHPASTLRRIVTAMRERGADNLPRLRSEWERHFSQRRPAARVG